MSVQPWTPGTTYAPGALCVPRSTAPPAVAALLNATLTDTTGWDVGAPVTINADGQGYGGGGRFNCSPPAGTGTALNQAHIGPIVAGQAVSANCMARHSTGDKHAADVGMTIVWYDDDDATVGTPAIGSGVPSLSSDAWQQISVSGTVPSGATYCRIGVSMRSGSADGCDASYFSLNYTPQTTTRAVMYEATQAKPGKSGSTEPVWPPAGQSVQDNEVTWNGVNIDRLVWQASPLLKSGDTEPTWPAAAGATVHDGTIDWIATVPVITDPNCPHSKCVAIAATHVFAGDKDIIRFSAAANPLDWTSPNDAGFLPTGLQQDASNDVSVLNLYRADLVNFSANGFQMWQVDPDPANMDLLDQRPGIGSIYQKAAQPVANDLVFLSQLGARSFGMAASTDNLIAGQIGVPVDPMVQAALDAMSNEPISGYYPSLGQYWLMIDDQAFVLTYSESGQPGAWTRYELPFTCDERPALIGNNFYLRSADGNLWKALRGTTADTPASPAAAVPVAGTIWSNWLDFKQPGHDKRMMGVDVVCSGDVALEVGYDQTNVAAFTAPFSIAADTMPGNMVPFEVVAPSFSIRLTLAPDANGNAWSFNMAEVYVQDNT